MLSRIHLIALAIVIAGASLASAQNRSPVILTEDNATYTLDNGIVKARVAKASGDLVSMQFKNMELLATFVDAGGQPDLQRDPPGENRAGLNRGMTDHQYGFWSHDAMGPRGSGDATARISIDPKSNGGQRAEVLVKGISSGRLMGTGPGAGTPGNFIADVEIRWTLGQGDSGIYTYCIFEHKPGYAASAITEARFCAKLADCFDWLSAGDKYNRLYPKEQERGEDKYVYTDIQSKNPAFGWSSSTKNVGFYCINPSMEYMSGGPTKPEFLGHRDTNPVAAPCVLNYWRSSHYGGAEVAVAADEQWTKVIGPFMLYVNSGADPIAMYTDAKAQAAKEIAKWPFDWVRGTDYPHQNERAPVSGQLVLSDPQMPAAHLPNLQVGLTYPAYQSAAPGPGGARQVDWQLDAKHYEFWTRGKEDGTFAIPNVRAGQYTLHAFADGVLGEFAKAEVVVESGKSLDLGKINWIPVRHGRQVWEIGVPNRNGSEFFKGDAYTELDISLQYAKLFPNDVHYVIGKSDFRKDWFFQHVPHNVDPAAVAVPFSGIRGGPGNATPYSVSFDLSNAPRGKATLRLAICGGGARSIDVTMNDQPVGQISRLVGDGVLTRHQIQGIWYEREVAFNASTMKPGTNELKLIVPAGPVNNGVIYDYLRLELDESAMP